jgi:hypothetical protein
MAMVAAAEVSYGTQQNNAIALMLAICVRSYAFLLQLVGMQFRSQFADVSTWCENHRGNAQVCVPVILCLLSSACYPVPVIQCLVSKEAHHTIVVRWCGAHHTLV